MYVTSTVNWLLKNLQKHHLDDTAYKILINFVLSNALYKGHTQGLPLHIANSAAGMAQGQHDAIVIS